MKEFSIVLIIVLLLVGLGFGMNKLNEYEEGKAVAEALILFPEVKPHMGTDELGRWYCLVRIETPYGASEINCVSYRNGLVKASVK